ncbi:phage capsid protein [Litorivivens sp.]|uniref:phage capsid protein n=1 Tax=Litorivivens sp. TaxID=2020868 RepID=UPI00356A2B01
MAESAMQKQYRQEFIAGFEKGQSLARRSVTTETVIKGNEAVFLVADTGGAEAVTRGLNGDIPTRPDNLNQFTATLREWHDVPERTNFNIFASQGDGRRIMQSGTRKVINRKIDADIHAELGNATLNWGAAQTAGILNVTKAKTMLANNFADDEMPFALITPAYHGYLMQLDQFTSVDYVNMKPFEGVSKSQAFSWYGVNWIVDAGLPGAGTASASCYMYSRSAIGHAMNVGDTSVVIGYDDKNDKSWARCSGFFGSKLLQNSGVIAMPHDDSALS